MDVKYLNCVLTIAEEKNLHRAAERLFVSQPALSQFLTRLEKEIGTPLFERRSRELVLTEAGKLYVQTAKTVVRLRNRLYQEIAELSYPAHLSIASTSQWGLRLIAQVLPTFKKLYPSTMVEVTESFFPSMAERLRKKEVDICLATVIEAGMDYAVERLGEEEIYLAAASGHPFARSHTDAVVDAKLLADVFSDDPFLFTSRGSTTQRLAEEWFRATGFLPQVFGYFDNIQTVLGLVAQGAGVCFVPRSCMTDDPQLRYFRLDGGSIRLSRRHIIAYRKDLFLTPDVRELLREFHAAYHI